MTNEITESNTKWSFNMTEEKDGVKLTTRVRQVENGYVICKEKSWKDGDEYKYEEKEYISKDNPMAKLTPQEETQKQVEALDSFFSSVGGSDMIKVD